MSASPACPLCAMENIYPDGDNLVCADCGHEWPAAGTEASGGVKEEEAKDSNVTVLVNGDAVVVIKDTKVTSSSVTLKENSKLKSIRLVGSAPEVDGIMDGDSCMLKACYLKKV